MLKPSHCIGVLAVCVAGSTNVERTHAESPRARIAQTRQATLDLLSDLSRANNPNWLLGQNAGHSNENLRAGYQKFVLGLEASTGEIPALLGIDLGYNETPNRSSSLVQVVTDYKSLPGDGIVAVSMHPASPFRNSDCHDVRKVVWDDLYVPGYIVQERWLRTLDRVANFLLELQDNGIVVLWRPFHEMNGGWFWWCARDEDEHWTSREEFVGLWKHMHTYLSERGVHNLLWVYSPAVQTDSAQRPANYYYPGQAFVDVVALDWYSDDLDDLNKYRSYEQLVQLNKPIGLGEFGPRKERGGRFDNLRLARAMRKFPHLGFAMYWQSWERERMAIRHLRNADRLVSLENVLTLQKLMDRSTHEPTSR